MFTTWRNVLIAQYPVEYRHIHSGIPAANFTVYRLTSPDPFQVAGGRKNIDKSLSLRPAVLIARDTFWQRSVEKKDCGLRTTDYGLRTTDWV